MHRDDLVTLFDRQAESYDAQWEGMAPIRDALFLLVDAAFADLPADARILCVGVGTGIELSHVAARFPAGRFTAVEPSGPMLDACRRRAEEEGFASRCTFHQGYLEALDVGVPHHAATCFLVSQFILDRDARTDFFRGIAARLRPDGLLASSDLASGAAPGDRDALLPVWLAAMSGRGVSSESIERARAAYASDVAVLPPATVASIIEAGGFAPPVQVYQAGLLHAWVSRRTRGDGAT